METDIIYLLCKKKASIDMWRIVMMAILCMQLVACSTATELLGKVGGTPSSTPTSAKSISINAAIEKCNLTTVNFVAVIDDGHSVMMLRNRMNNKAFDLGLECVMRELGIPTYISYLMTAAVPSDGMQKEENDAYNINWQSYDDSGENRSVIIHMK